MAEERDPKLSQHYRELEALEPPPELDQAILAAARSARQTPRAPLIAPSGRRRWYYPLAAAAVLVFAVALTLHVERERPDAEPASQAAPQLRLEHELHGEIRPAPATDRLAAEQQPRPAPQAQAGSAFAPDPRADSAPARQPSTAQVDEPSARRDSPESRAAAAQPQLRLRSEAALAGQDTPEQWLERIAELRSRGRHEEADKALAEFRRAYPDYRLTDAMRERVERR